MTTAASATNKRPAIIQAALELFSERGIDGTTTREIAARAGITEGAIYRHFPSKDALAGGIFVDCMDRLLEQLQAAAAAEGTHQERLCRTACAFLAFAGENPEAYGYIMAAHQVNLAELASRRAKPKDVFAEIIADGITAGEFREMDVQLATALVVGMCIRTIFFWDSGLLVMSKEDVHAGVCDAARRVLT